MTEKNLQRRIEKLSAMLVVLYVVAAIDAGVLLASGFSGDGLWLLLALTALLIDAFAIAVFRHERSRLRHECVVQARHRG